MSDLKLTDREWKGFRVEDLFYFENKSSKGLNHLKQCDDGVNYVGATNRNNGVLAYVEANQKVIYKGNAIAFIRNGEGSMGYSVYKAEDFVATQDISVGYNENLNRYIGLFIVAVADKVRGKYNFGYKRNQKRLNKETLQLPINSDGLPDWQFMEDFIKQKEQKQIADLKDYYADKAVELMISTGSLKNTRWKSFFIGGKEGIFQIKATKSGIDKNKLKVAENGKTPYITRSDMDNGINLFASDEQMPKSKKDDGNVITIGLDTQTVFYQKNSFWTGQNIQVLSNDNLNYWVAMFIIPLLKIQMKKFAWGSTGATLGRLNRTRIMLPVNSDGLPDWQFMEDFMKQIERDKIAAVLSYYNNSLNNNSLRGG